MLRWLSFMWIFFAIVGIVLIRRNPQFVIKEQETAAAQRNSDYSKSMSHTDIDEDH